MKRTCAILFLTTLCIFLVMTVSYADLTPVITKAPGQGATSFNKVNSPGESGGSSGSSKQPVSANEQIAALYHEILGRAPDAQGLQYWITAMMKGESLDSIRQAFYQSDEYKAKGVNEAAVSNGLAYGSVYGSVENKNNKITVYAAAAGSHNDGPVTLDLATGVITYLSFGSQTGQKTVSPNGDLGQYNTVLDGMIQKCKQVLTIVPGENNAPLSESQKAFVNSTIATLAGHKLPSINYGTVGEDGSIKPVSLNDQITVFYRQILGREPEDAGLQYWITQAMKGMSLESIRDAFFNSVEYKSKNTAQEVTAIDKAGFEIDVSKNSDTITVKEGSDPRYINKDTLNKATGAITYSHWVDGTGTQTVTPTDSDLTSYKRELKFEMIGGIAMALGMDTLKPGEAEFLQSVSDELKSRYEVLPVNGKVEISSGLSGNVEMNDATITVYLYGSTLHTWPFHLDRATGDISYVNQYAGPNSSKVTVKKGDSEYQSDISLMISQAQELLKTKDYKYMSQNEQVFIQQVITELNKYAY